MNETETKRAFSITPFIEGILTFNNKKLNFKPYDLLEFNTTYTVTISTDAIDLEGTKLQEEFIWSFTTENKKEIKDPDIKNKEDQESSIFGFYTIISISIITILIILIIILFLKIRKKKPKTSFETKPELLNQPIEPTKIATTNANNEQLMPVQAQSQIQPQAQPQAQPQIQPQIQALAQPRIPPGDQFAQDPMLTQLPMQIPIQPPQQTTTQILQSPQTMQPMQQFFCSTCGQPLTYIQQTNGYFCFNCQK
jgi:hypothetical protein